MRAVIQRVASAHVVVADQTIGAIESGLMILLSICKNDTEKEGPWLADKIAKLRIFPDDDGNMNRSLIDHGGRALVVSQFTLHARTRKGTRPSFNDAAAPALAEPLYEKFLLQLQTALSDRPVAAGKFGAMMQVHLVNDGPVTIILDTEDTR
jgi:D-tyrosyl-tRNA(Tyr) deacylase